MISYFHSFLKYSDCNFSETEHWTMVVTHVCLWLAVKLTGGRVDGQHVAEVPSDKPGIWGAQNIDSGHRERPQKTTA